MIEMQKKDIESFFPRKCFISSEMILVKDIGTVLLKSFLPEELHNDIFWGLSIGNVAGVKIKVEETIVYNGETIKVPLYLDNHIVTPREIIFEVRN